MRPIGTACYFNGHIKDVLPLGHRISGSTMLVILAEDRRPVLALFRARVRLRMRCTEMLVAI